MNIASDSPDGIHNDVDTRAKLAAYDRALYDLVDEVFGGAVLANACP